MNNVLDISKKSGFICDMDVLYIMEICFCRVFRNLWNG